MGKQKRGNLLGTVGNTVYYEMWGENYVRSKPKRGSRRKSTLKQKVQQMKMSLVSPFLKKWLEVIRISFKTENPKVSGYNAARSDMLLHAIDGEYPDLKIDFSKVKMSIDPESGIQHIDALATTEQIHLDITWKDFWPKHGATLYVVCYNEDKNQHHILGPHTCSNPESIDISWDSLEKENRSYHCWAMLFQPLGTHFYGSHYFKCEVK
ncbi:DUF6266 family protein [Halosquirtibacter xylanolyticus]|uniref:DUF6266 family protein n=1 Tax=Halosquirtibacter xylanolyticus TaxID=3374599 RepID=UPI003749CC16|nr:DUF6266 family protein [Prolixibacteraceae bacterium]